MQAVLLCLCWSTMQNIPNTVLKLAMAVLAHELGYVLQATSITAQSYGDVTLLANADTAVRLTAGVQAACATASTVPGSTLVFANLNPVELDVDAGEAFGLQVQRQAGKTATPVQLQVGSNYTMDIRVNSASSPLIAFEVCGLNATFLCR